MGYQVHIATLQASEYGAPADRSRVIIWAALPGCELPEFPQPTHASTGSSTRPVASWHRKTHFAPHAMISFAEATSDLPKFEYQNPHNIIGQTATDRYIRTERAKTIRQCRVNPGDSYVGRDSQDYASPPISDFQRQCRNGSAKVTNHVTRAFHDKPSLAKEKNGDEFLFRNCTTERICNIPIEASADHGSLPAKLRQGSCYHPANDSSKSVTKKKYCYSRIKYDEPMRTVRTRIDPASKWGRVSSFPLPRY
jgi:DNA (cytosine-5)-methyltransferase 1